MRPKNEPEFDLFYIDFNNYNRNHYDNKKHETLTNAIANAGMRVG
jgi:hypothetical protein